MRKMACPLSIQVYVFWAFGEKKFCARALSIDSGPKIRDPENILGSRKPLSDEIWADSSLIVTASMIFFSVENGKDG